MQLKTACGHRIYIPEHTLNTLTQHQHLLGLVQQAVRQVHLPADGRMLREAVAFPEAVGQTDCVKAAPIAWNQETTFAQRPQRRFISRVETTVTEGPQTNLVTIVAVPYSRRLLDPYRLVAAWIGDLAPMEPWDPNLRLASQAERIKAMDFWCQHALVYDPQTMGQIKSMTWEQVCAHPNITERRS